MLIIPDIQGAVKGRFWTISVARIQRPKWPCFSLSMLSLHSSIVMSYEETIPSWQGLLDMDPLWYWTTFKNHNWNLQTKMTLLRSRSIDRNNFVKSNEFEGKTSVGYHPQMAALHNPQPLNHIFFKTKGWLWLMLKILKVSLNNPGRKTTRDPYVMVYEIIPHITWVVCKIPNKKPGARPFSIAHIVRTLLILHRNQATRWKNWLRNTRSLTENSEPQKTANNYSQPTIDFP